MLIALLVSSLLLGAPIEPCAGLPARLRAANHPMAAAVTAGGLPAPIATPFLKSGVVCRLTLVHPAGSESAFFALLGAELVELSADPSALVGFARRAGLLLDTPEQRAAYLDVAFRVLGLQRVEAVEAIPWRTANAAGGKRLAALKARLAKLVRPARVEGDGPWSLQVFGLRAGTLERVTVTLSKEGELRLQRRVVATALPVLQGA